MRSTFMALMGVMAIAASPADARSCRSSKQDVAQIDRVIRSFFDALGKDDRAGFHRTVTADFYAFEVGKQLTAAELFGLIEEAHRAGRIINWTIGPIAVRADCGTAWAAWENRGSAGVPPNLAPRRWMESAALRRSPTGWRLEFLHSTIAPAGK
jgi:hypothetical protein